MIGIALTFGGINKMKTCEKIDAIIESIDYNVDSDGDKDYEVYVKYTYDGEDIENYRLNTYSSSWNEGDIISLYINPETKAVSDVKTEMFLGIFFTILSVVCEIGFLVGFYKGKEETEIIDNIE